jgi:hypothetical protein
LIAAGGTAFLFYLYRRITWLLNLSGSRKRRPKIRHSIRNLILLALLISSAISLLFAGFFMQSYQRFTREIPVAEVRVSPAPEPETFYLTLIRMDQKGEQAVSEYLIHGDQWMIEADIIKWDNWLTFLGLDTRYRLTRLRGRYRETDAERSKPASVYALDPREKHPLWSHLYDTGHALPFISAVYGNAVYQYGQKTRQFLLYVTNSGLLIRIKHEEQE